MKMISKAFLLGVKRSVAARANKRLQRTRLSAALIVIWDGGCVESLAAEAQRYVASQSLS